MADETKKINIWEVLGGLSFVIFSTGFILFLIGSYNYWTYNSIDLNTKHNYTSFETLLLPALLIIPFIIQVSIFFGFFYVSRRDQELSDFFKIYSGVMCFGLGSYSFFWLIYNYVLRYWQSLSHSAWKEGSSYFIAGFSGLSLLAICILIWIIILCTRVITRQNVVKSGGLIYSPDLTDEQYKSLCNKLDAVLNLQDIETLNNKTLNDGEIRRILTSKDNSEGEREKIMKAVEVFAAQLLPLQLPLADADTKIDEIISVLTDKEQPVQIKPLKRILFFLQDDKNIWIHTAITKKDFHSVSKHMLIKSLNKILMDSRFFKKEEFEAKNPKNNEETPVKTASSYFLYTKDHFIEKVQIENRALFDFHILGKSEDLSSSQKQEAIFRDSDNVENKRNTIYSMALLWLDERKELKIKEGLIRFPFSMLAFFLTIFICIVYLFAFTFAFHDQSILLNDSTANPGIFMANDYLSKKFDSNINQNTDDNAGATADKNNTNTNSVKNTVSNSGANNKSENQQTFFIFYESSAAGIDTTLPDNSKIESSKKEMQKCIELDNKFQEVLFEKKYNLSSSKNDLNSKNELKGFRKLANQVSLCYLLQQIRKNAPTSKKIYIEILGRADDAPLRPSTIIYPSTNSSLSASPTPTPTPLPQQTYSANFELSLARAQSLKFELVRQLQVDPDILERIEWSYLPVSNDASLGGDYPLNESKSRPLIVNNNSKSLDSFERDKLVKKIVDNLSSVCDADTNKTPDQTKALDIKKQYFIEQRDKAKSLLEKDKIKSSEAGNALFLSLQKAHSYYETLANNTKGEKILPDDPKYFEVETNFDIKRNKIGTALFYFDQDLENANKRTSEIYITSIPENEAISRIDLNLTDYMLYSITKGGYGDIKPTTMYAKFLSMLINIIEIFFIVIFFSALLSVKRVNEEDETFN